MLKMLDEIVIRRPRLSKVETWSLLLFVCSEAMKRLRALRRRKTTTKNLPWTLTSEQLWQSLQPVLEAGKSVILQNQDQETTLSLDPWNWKIVDFSAYKILVHSAQFAKVISDSDWHVVTFYRDSKWTKDSLPKGAKPGKKHRFDSQVDDFKLLWWHRKFFRRQVRNSKCHFLVFNSASDFLPIHY